MSLFAIVLAVCLGLPDVSLTKVPVESLGFQSSFEEQFFSSCTFSNPLRDLSWLKNMHQSHPGKSIAEYKKYGKTIFKIFDCKNSSSLAYWYDCSGHYKGKTNQNDQALGNHIALGATFIKLWFTTCTRPVLSNPVCLLNSFYKLPYRNQHFSKGSNVVVHLDAQQHRNISYADLYLNEQLIRRETNYPYQWGTNSHPDRPLKGMARGTYTLKAIIKDQCGETQIRKRTFHVF